MDNELLVKSIRDLCKKNNMAVSQLENDLNFGAGLISRWVKSSPSIDKILDIADYFHVTSDDVVGRNNISDEFLKALYNKTYAKEIQWKSFNKNTDEYGIQQYEKMFDYELLTTAEEYEQFCNSHKQISYYFEYSSGYISIYSLYEHHYITNPKELRLFIQPDIQAELIPQSYSYAQLLPLWLKILTSLDENVPDEIKAEDLKQQFISNLSAPN